jgi:hypothetical protein
MEDRMTIAKLLRQVYEAHDAAADAVEWAVVHYGRAALRGHGVRLWKALARGMVSIEDALVDAGGERRDPAVILIMVSGGRRRPAGPPGLDAHAAAGKALMIARETFIRLEIWAASISLGAHSAPAYVRSSRRRAVRMAQNIRDSIDALCDVLDDQVCAEHPTDAAALRCYYGERRP